jgi:hypothetical protein
VTFDPARLVDLWNRPPTGAEPFAALYTDPVVINGTPVTVAQLVGAARQLHRTYADQSREIVDVADAGAKVAVAFVLRARQVGPLHTALGTVEATGAFVEARVIDILTLTGDRISAVTVVSDELDVLRQLGKSL